METFNPEYVLALAGVVLSLAFEYVPKLHSWYNSQTDNYQKLIMLSAIAGVVFGTLGLSCVEWLNVFACDAVGVREAVSTFVLAVVFSQGTHKILPKKESKAGG